MRLTIWLIALMLAETLPAAAWHSLDWVSESGGIVSTNQQGAVVAIDLRASWVGDADLRDLAAISTLRKLDLSETRITDHGLRQLKNASGITDLNLRFAESITGEGISALKSWKQLKRLNLAGTKISDSALQQISQLNSLEELNIGGVLVTDAGLEALTSLAHLRELTLGGNKLTDAGLEPLRQLPGLTYLDLGGVQREDSGIWMVSFSQSGLEAIATLKDLCRLRLHGTLMTDRGLQTIKGLAHLEMLDLHDCLRISDDAVTTLATMRTLRLVDLSGTKVTAAGVEKLRRANPNCRVLMTPSNPRLKPSEEEP